MKKAQSEIIIIVGIVIVATVALLAVTYQAPPSPTPTGVAQTQKAVKDSFLTLASESAEEVIIMMEKQGGYLSSDLLDAAPLDTVDGVTFVGQGVPYWQTCEQDISPSTDQLEEWMGLGVEIMIIDHLNELVFDKEVIFDASQLDVRAKILDNKVDFAVTLPTTVEGQPIIQPYSFSIPTRFGRIVDFAHDYAQEATTTRFNEIHSIASLYFSPPAEDGQPDIPTYGYLMNCGETIYRSPDDLAAGMKHTIAYTLASTLWWQPRPIDPAQPMVYAVEAVNGNTYPDLSFGHYFPDGFDFVFRAPLVITNTENDYEFFPPFSVPNCLYAYNQKYNLVFPIVTSVEDDLTGSNFNFASKLYIENPGEHEKMIPGSCNTLPSPVSGEACSDLSCTASLTITDSLGVPLEGAKATYGGCLIGNSNAAGIVTGPVSCGSQELLIFKEGYDLFAGVTATPSGSYTLSAVPTYTFHFIDVEIEDPLYPFPPVTILGTTHFSPPGFSKCTLTPTNPSGDAFSMVQLSDQESTYALSNIDPDANTFPPDPSVCETDISQCLNALTPTIEVSHFPTGAYTFDADTYSISATSFSGGFLTDYTLPPTDDEIFFHLSEAVPAFTYDPLADLSFDTSEKETETKILRDSCSIEPVSDSTYKPVTYNVHTCSCEHLLDVVNDVTSFCTTSAGDLITTTVTGEDTTHTCTKSEVVSQIESDCSSVNVIC